MRRYVPPLSAIADTRHVVWRYRDRYKAYCILFLGLLFLSLPLPAATVAITTSYSVPTQCGPFTITWVGQWPSFELLILPFDAEPIWIAAPGQGFSYNIRTNTSSYTLDMLRLKSGTQFLATMDFGYGALFRLSSDTFQPECSHYLLATIPQIGKPFGPIPLIQIVGESSDSSCLTPDISPTSSFFTFDPPVPLECNHQIAAWNTTRYSEPPGIRGFIPGGETFRLTSETSLSATRHFWEVNLREGTQFILLIQSMTPNQRDGNSRTSALMTVTGKSNDIQNCLVVSGEHKSTITLDPTTPTSSIITSTTTTKAPEASMYAVNVK